jgi:hypothetical protein
LPSSIITTWLLPAFGFVMNIDRQWIFDWVPMLLIFVGLAGSYVGFPYLGLATFIGFACYGLFGLIEVFSNRIKSFSMLKILKVFTLALILLIGLTNVFVSLGYFIVQLSLVLLDRLILTPARVGME